ncbi:copper chaperone PCu(A)C [Photobacterium japonica]|uniref:copper chaperone PCu(A)C n=1 Tax=Photobacterium japonica TaxID=2910235 RepID=UPI003D12FCB2
MNIIRTTLLGSLFAVAAFAQAHDVQLGDLTIDHPWSKQVPPTSQVAAAFFMIDNQGMKEDVLLRASSPIAGKTELHAHIHEDGMMKMREVESIPVPAHDTTLLKPGGLHVMFFELETVPTLGEMFPLTLYFKYAGKVNVEVKVEPATFVSEAMKNDAEEHAIK